MANLKELVENHPITIYLGVLIIGFLAGIAAYNRILAIAKLETVRAEKLESYKKAEAESLEVPKLRQKLQEKDSKIEGIQKKLSESNILKDKLEQQLSGWEFSEDLYCKAPVDIDFMARGLTVNREVGSEMLVLGPQKKDEYQFKVTGYQEVGPSENRKDAVTFLLRYNLDGNKGENISSAPLILERGTLSPPIIAVPYVFYIYIDDINTRNTVLTIMRKRIFKKGIFSNSHIIGNAIAVENIFIPETILSSCLNNQKKSRRK